jgi:transcriptional regulator with XRE-family HTH domain
MTGKNAYAYGTQRKPANAHVGPEKGSYSTEAAGSVRSDGPNGKSAQAPVGPDCEPERSDAGTHDGNGFDGSRAPAPIGPESVATRSHGANPNPAYAPIGPETNVVDHGNGSDTARAQARIGPSVDPNHSATVSSGSTGQSGKSARGRVRPILDGNTDTRGLVDDSEREHLAAGYGAVIRGLRKRAGLTQVQLGQLAGIGVTHISRLEQGRRRPSVDATKALARILSPEPDPTRLEQRLAELAGESLREGAARRKRRQENKHRREAVALMSKTTRRMRNHMADLERRGLPVSDSLRRFAEADTVERLAGSKVEDEPGIEGYTPVMSARDRTEQIRADLKAIKRRRRQGKALGKRWIRPA